MSTLATALKSEIVQAAQKTLRDEAQALRKATSAYEREITALQRRVASLEQRMARLNGHAGRAGGAAHHTARGSRPHRTSGAMRAPVLIPRNGPGNGASPQAAQEGDDTSGTALRFSAKGFAKLRQRLGLSAAALGTLLGVTAQSIYKWEDGKSRPRATQLRAIAVVRKMGKREAAARLAEIEGHGLAPASEAAEG